MKYLLEVCDICSGIDHEKIERMVDTLATLKGKLYIMGLGGSMANAIHMAADMRKLCDIDAEAFDNIAELTARANDEGFDTIFVDWLKRSGEDDALMILSVGGGTDQVSKALCRAIDVFEGTILGIVGPVGGYTAEKGDCVIRIPVKKMTRVTPHTEAFQALIWHCIVSHPKLQKRPTKW